MVGGDQLQLFLLGAGECLVDNVEVIPSGGANLVANGTFDAGTSGWYFQGTHEESAWQASGGFSGGCLHIVASDRGDTAANRIRTVLTQTLAEGSMATLRAKVRWLKGHPEILLRLHGNWLEATGNTLTTRDLGSPGGRNTRKEPANRLAEVEYGLKRRGYSGSEGARGRARFVLGHRFGGVASPVCRGLEFGPRKSSWPPCKRCP